MDTVTVTGGAGFIGSSLVRLLAEDHHVVVVDNLSNGRRENLAGLLDANVELVVADIRDTDRLLPIFRQSRIVYHLACLGVRHSIHSPKESHEVNATATLDLLLLARQTAVERFVYISTSEVYGTARTVPMTEEHPTFPCTVYGAAKLAGECYARAFYRTYGYPTVIVRPFNAFGPRAHHEGDSGEVIPKFMLRSLSGRPLVVFGDGMQTRDFTFVDDTARAIGLAGLTPGIEGETLNVGSGAEVSINALAEQVAAVTGRDLTVAREAGRPGDVLRLLADVTKARTLLGYRPSIELTQGLQKLRAWYLEQAQSPEGLLEAEVTRNWDAMELQGVPSSGSGAPNAHREVLRGHTS